jgi:phytoene synthase
MNPTDPERALALTYAPQSARGALHALWALDATLGGIVRSGTDPMVAQLRLTWWFEALVGLDTASPPAEPILTALASEVLPTGVTGAALAVAIDGWEELLAPDPLDDDALLRFAGARATLTFVTAAAMLGHPDANGVAAAGQGWALIDLARHVRDPALAGRAQALAQDRLADAPRYWPGDLRALGALAMLARGDAGLPLDRLPPIGAPRRIARMAWHRLSGR